ncbi:MAG: DNA replication/repair protein RecF [Paracoccaceae bacterium]
MGVLAVTELTVSHFRSHQLARLEFQAGPVAIYGPNGAGKTNLLEAISLLSPGRGLRRATLDDMARRPQSLGWKIRAGLTSLHQSHAVETWVEPGGPRQTRIDDKAATQVALGRIARILWLVPSMDRLWTEGADGRRRFVDRMTLSFKPSHAEAVLTYEKAMRERNRLLKDQVRDASWYGALEDQMATSGAAILANRTMAISRVTDAQKDAKTAFPRADLTLYGPEGVPLADGRDALVAAFEQGRAQDMYAGRTLSGPHRADLRAIYADKNVAARDCSTGEQKALLISLILANARALADDFGAPPILLLDEVAAHLDATRRAALYDEICAIGAQAFMTGTGAELFEDLGTRAQYLHVTEDDNTSVVQQA